MLIQKSFYTFQQQKALPQLRSEQKALYDELNSDGLALSNPELAMELHATIHSEVRRC